MGARRVLLGAIIPMAIGGSGSVTTRHCQALLQATRATGRRGRDPAVLAALARSMGR
jgi:hypothetical protein